MISVKVCNCCGVEKPRSSFWKSSQARDGLRTFCKDCCNERYGEKTRLANRERVRKNPEKNRARVKAWRMENDERRQASLERVKKWRKENPERFKAVDHHHCRQRYARKMKAIPPWANMFFIKEIYDLAKQRTKLTGVKHHVDHIVPLKSDIVCGLHCEQNLRVIPAVENLRKGNLVWPDMP